MDTLDRWIRDASALGLGSAETNAMSAIKEILERDEARAMLGMGGGGGGTKAADEALLRRLRTINLGVNSAGTRTLPELADIILRAKKSKLAGDMTGKVFDISKAEF